MPNLCEFVYAESAYLTEKTPSGKLGTRKASLLCGPSCGGYNIRPNRTLLHKNRICTSIPRCGSSYASQVLTKE